MLSNLSLGTRFAGVLAASMAVGIVVSTLTNSWLTSRMTGRIIDDTLERFDQILTNQIRDEGRRAQLLADGLAVNTDIQNAFAERDRDSLVRMLVPGFQKLKEEHGLVQLQFHTPQATSFLRVHSPKKFGDDLSAFRLTVVDVNKNRAPAVGLESGVEGLGIRGVVPIIRDSKHLGFSTIVFSKSSSVLQELMPLFS